MKKLLVFQHIQREKPSYIGEYAAERGIELDVVELWKPFTIPELSLYDALVILGGPMSAYNDYQGKQKELTAISKNIGRLPMLGICLGAQLLAYALGARVYPCERDSKRYKEVGYYDVTLTPEGRASPLFSGCPQTFKVLQWHGDTFDLPEGALHTATAPLCAHQAFSRGTAHGLQFHIEATPEMVANWIKEDATWTHEGFTMNEAQVLADARSLAPTMKDYCYRLMDNFLH